MKYKLLGLEVVGPSCTATYLTVFIMVSMRMWNKTQQQNLRDKIFLVWFQEAKGLVLVLSFTYQMATTQVILKHFYTVQRQQCSNQILLLSVFHKFPFTENQKTECSYGIVNIIAFHLRYNQRLRYLLWLLGREQNEVDLQQKNQLPPPSGEGLHSSGAIQGQHLWALSSRSVWAHRAAGSTVR